MEYIINADTDRWIRPWNITKFNELDDRDERFFSLVTKGMLSWMNQHIFMYDKPIKHYIFNTGSTYMYVESNGYEFKWAETSGEDWMYMETPRCLVSLDSFAVPTEELTAPSVHGIYERKSSVDEQIHGYNADMRRLPIEVTANFHYVLSNFNESIILVQELYDAIIFQKYFTINYLGQDIDCSIELPADQKIEFPMPDLSSTEPNQKTISISIKVCTNYPIIDVRTEARNDGGLIASAIYNTNISNSDDNNRNMIYGSEVYRAQEGGYYSRFTKKFYKDSSHSTLIEPNLYTIYIDLTDEDKKLPYHYDGKEYVRDYNYDLLDSASVYNSSSIDVN